MKCYLCPRSCGADREAGELGRCRCPALPHAARAARHDWEEPCLSGTRGSGAVFFSGCNLGCVYCQNREISREIKGKPLDAGGLREVWGLDFGFTHDPTALVRILADTGRKIAYIDERCYRTGMLNRDISSHLQGEGIRRGIHIWADAAEPKSIAEIGRDTGLSIQPSNKSAPSQKNRLVFQIQWMQGWKFYVTKSSVNWIKEGRNYTWKKDRDGNLVNEPIDTWNHLMDATRYALYSEFAGNTGTYSIGMAR